MPASPCYNQLVEHVLEVVLHREASDLLALTRGDLSFAKAWSSGRLRLDAGIRDILRLRSLI